MTDAAGRGGVKGANPVARCPNMNRATLLLLTLLGSLLSGCASYVPFTHEVRTQHSLNEDDIRQLQFYLSHDITLRREVRTRGREIVGGELKLMSGKTVEEIIIEARTPGVAVAVNRGAIMVSFEEGSALPFSIFDDPPIDGPLQIVPAPKGFAEPPDAFPADRPADPFADITGNYFLTAGSKIQFRGTTWELVGSSQQAHLLIDAESLDEVEERRVKIGGRKL
jgi:hypothetical protein